MFHGIHVFFIYFLSTEICPIEEGMDDETVISDDQLSGSGNTVAGSSVTDIRPSGSGWKVKTEDEDGNPPYLTIDFSDETTTPILAYIEVLVSIVKFRDLVQVSLQYNRVPTLSGNQGKPGKRFFTFPVMEKSGNFIKIPKIREKLGFLYFFSASSNKHKYFCIFFLGDLLFLAL